MSLGEPAGHGKRYRGRAQRDRFRPGAAHSLPVRLDLRGHRRAHPPGSNYVVNGEWSILGGGKDIWGSKDEFHS